ncbi:hypothetical protein [Smaragdicoccus niigatensis]|uniref:hypothetical protein n=1 Tax=Smaragdicoccus niigatensis TaxID=359359 RepID=UPI00036F3169|nr:hypothetical protein [Smaragdicoccus niigatensis]
MHEFWEFAGSYWWLVFVFGGAAGGWAKSVAMYNEKRRQDKIEMLRIKHGAKNAALEESRVTDKRIDRALAAHDDINARWFAYETDALKVIEFPLMTDMREPLTVAFHEAKSVADDLRPTDRAALRDQAELERFENAVRDFRLAFDIAEREAQRQQQRGFSDSERGALDRARKLINVAADDGATAAERQSAYKKARKELDGLIVLPKPATDAIETRIAGALESGR